MIPVEYVEFPSKVLTPAESAGTAGRDSGEVSILRPILQSLTTIHCVAGTPVFHQELVCVVSCFVMWHLEEVTHCDVVIQTFRGHRRGMIVFMARVNSWDCLEISIMMK